MSRSRNLVVLCALGMLASVQQRASAADEPASPPYVACEACHGPGGNSPIPGMLAPKLSGLDAAYIVKQLHDFKYKRRIFEAMNTMAKDLTEADIKADAEYFASQTRTPDDIADAALAKTGEAIVKHGIGYQGVPACVNCHNDGATGTFRYPRLAGQKSDYLVNQLTHLKSGERHNDFGFMGRVAMHLTDDQIKAVAEYLSSLPSKHEFVAGLQGHW